MSRIGIQLKRVYDPVGASDGRRYLVDRLWPRGIKKEALAQRLLEPMPDGVLLSFALTTMSGRHGSHDTT